MKPSDFFIGVIDFFSVLLPGALLTWFLQRSFYADIFGADRLFPEPTSEASRWAVFLLYAYIIGNLIFMMAAFLDSTYDRVLRKSFRSKNDLAFKTARLFRGKYIETDMLLKELFLAKKLSNADYQKILLKPDHEIFNTFKWSQHFLLFNKPEALAAIQRTEADSKFFRSLVVTFLIIAIILMSEIKLPIALFFLVFSFLCYYRFGELRFKATEKAYEMIITFFSQTPKDSLLINNEEKPKKLILKTEMTADFEARHHELILFLAKGSSKRPKQIVIDPSTGDSQIFVPDKDELWHCAQGRGTICDLNGDKDTTALTSNAIVPLKKGIGYSIVCGSNEPIEVLSWEN